MKLGDTLSLKNRKTQNENIFEVIHFFDTQVMWLWQFQSFTTGSPLAFEWDAQWIKERGRICR